VRFPASDKQVALITKLASEREWASSDQDFHGAVSANSVIRNVLQGKVVGSRDASAAIDFLFTSPKVTSSVAGEIEAGVYVNPNGVTYRVYLGQQSGRMLAAEVVQHGETAEFVYAGSAERYVARDARRLSIEEAAAFGKATGTCIVCARRLDVPESVDRGIGPVCYAKMGGM
jgi:hypothetical protein